VSPFASADVFEKDLSVLPASSADRFITRPSVSICGGFEKELSVFCAICGWLYPRQSVRICGLQEGHLCLTALSADGFKSFCSAEQRTSDHHTHHR
jgi:hypothetical protein